MPTTILPTFSAQERLYSPSEAVWEPVPPVGFRSFLLPAGVGKVSSRRYWRLLYQNKVRREGRLPGEVPARRRDWGAPCSGCLSTSFKP